MSEVKEPSKIMSMDEFYEATDNGNKLMDRVWYCLGSTEAVSDQKVFWEHWYWKEGEKSKEIGSKPKEGCNHTLTIESKGENKVVDYPVWPLTFTKDYFKMWPAIDLKCTVIAPIGLTMQPIMFPTDDSRTEFRVDFCSMMGKKLYFIFVLDPLISEEAKNTEFEKLESEFGVKKEWFQFVQWEEKYIVGSAGEPDINPK